MSRKQRRAEIAGAGLAGLMLATRLAQLDWQVCLHERDDTLRTIGGGIWLWENGLKALSMIGALQPATRRARSIKEWRIVDENRTILMSRKTSSDDRFLLPPRQDLHLALVERARESGVRILTSSMATAVEPTGKLIMENGEQRSADLVVAADGAYSLLRHSICRSCQPELGTEGSIRTLIDARSEDTNDIVVEYWNGPWRIGYNPSTTDQHYIFLNGPISDQPARMIPIDKETWLEKFPFLSDLIRRLTDDGRWDRYVSVNCKHWVHGHAALLGDAAHAMQPNLGQAANMAFVNAIALAAAVDASDDIPAALQSWEEMQRPLTDYVQWFSRVYGIVVQRWPVALLKMRSIAIRALGRTDWFDDALNRGARHTPANYNKGPAGN